MNEGHPATAGEPPTADQPGHGEEWSADPHWAALAESEERFRLAMDHSAVAMNITGPDGRFLRVNPAMSRLFGREPGDLLARTWQELTHPDDLAADEALSAELHAGTRDHYRMTKRYLRPDGSEVWGDLTVSCVRAEDGSIDYAIAQIIDVSERQKAVSALGRSEELLAAVMDQAPVAMGVTNLDGSFVRVNEGMAEFFGLSTTELLGLTWQDLTDPDSVPEETAIIGELMRGERDHYRLLKDFVRVDGGHRCGLLSVSCLRGDDGVPRLLVGQIVDVTPQEEALGRLQATLDSMLDPHALFEPIRDSEGRLVDVRYAAVNDAACTYLRRPREDLLGAAVSGLFHGPAVEALVRWCDTTLLQGRLSQDDIPLPGASDDSERWFDVRAVSVDGFVSLSWRDVTQRHLTSRALEERESSYRLLADNATDVIIRTDMITGIVWVSPSVAEVLGWRPDELTGRRVSDLMHPDDLAAARRRQREFIASGAAEGRITARFATADGGWRWMSDHGRAIFGDDGSMIGGIDSLRDVQAEHDAQDALAARESELRGVIDSLIDPWVLFHAVRDDEGRIVDLVYADANDAACEFNQTSREELIGASLLTLLPDHGPTGIFAKYAAVVETGAPLADDDEPFRSPHDGIVRRYDNRAVKVGDGLSLTWRDVTERYEARQTLHRHAEQDLLTGVANRRQFDRRLEELAARAPRTGTLLGLLYCDVDHFKDVNDNLGHAAGDEILASVAQGIRSAVRDVDVVARLGGDEFVIILDGVRGVADAQAVAEKVAKAASRPIRIAGITITPRLSIGVALGRRGEDPHAALARADDALYRAKREGRDRIVVDEST